VPPNQSSERTRKASTALAYATAAPAFWAAQLSCKAVQNHFFPARNHVAAKHPEMNGIVTVLTRMFLTGFD
jgi:hypothetical protein